jgi:hypothetical protein
LNRLTGDLDMNQLPDVYSYIKLIDTSTGQALPNGAWVNPQSCPAVIVRYVVVNDSNTATGSFTAMGALRRDSVALIPHPVMCGNSIGAFQAAARFRSS